MWPACLAISILRFTLRLTFEELEPLGLFDLSIVSGVAGRQDRLNVAVDLRLVHLGALARVVGPQRQLQLGGVDLAAAVLVERIEHRLESLSLVRHLASRLVARVR